MKNQKSKIEISVELDENKIPEKFYGQPVMVALKTMKQKQLFYQSGIQKEKKVYVLICGLRTCL